jgi:6-pyruvoyltetrahydropterin/6-carboxytetrahydropterin synthase
MPASLSRVVGFHARHHLARPEWSAARNREAFGPLSDPAGHAHDYRCIVTVRGPIAESHGMVMDLAALDRLLDTEVVARLDGRHLNRDIPAFAEGGMLPTCEAIAADVFARVAPRLPAGVVLERVRILEDPTLYADWSGLP